ncbi:MAG: hypothetical protein QNJ03_02060 [Dinoroseobacter sp.]|nr:hypothetical protein [Dinoroseobacter sp.]
MLWQEPWVWLAGGLALAILEVVIPGYIFLGFGIGAALTGVALIFAGPEASFAQSLPLLILCFAILSLVSWLGLRRVLGIRAGQVKTFDRDINED